MKYLIVWELVGESVDLYLLTNVNAQLSAILRQIDGAIIGCTPDVEIEILAKELSRFLENEGGTRPYYKDVVCIKAESGVFEVEACTVIRTGFML